METKTLDDLIADTYSWDIQQRPIMDGIINESIYLVIKPKILWILWEPYDDGGWDKWKWDSRKWINAEPQTFSHRTWRNIAITSHGILHNLNYDEVICKGNQEIFETLKSIAYLNIIKYPGEHTSKNIHPRLKKVYSNCSTVLHKQIIDYAPDIIIGGNALYLFLEYFNLKYEEGLSFKKGRTYWVKDSKLFIDSKHPRVLTKNFSNEIISNATGWLNEVQGKTFLLKDAKV